MTYASTNRRPNPAALAGALGIPGALGALMVVGLAVTVTVVPDTPNPQGRDIPTVPLPPPPPDPVEPTNRTNPTTQQASSSTAQTRADMLPVDLGQGDPMFVQPGTGDLIGPITEPVDFGIPQPTPSAALFKPVGAAPRGNPGTWVTNGDYRSRWIREGLTGSARFSLSIDATGRVTGCTITRSTGHAALDEATCQLVTRRARFDAARDASGKPVAGTYANTVTWNIPE